MTDPEKVRTVAEWPQPDSLTKLQRFLGFEIKNWMGGLGGGSSH